jgi:hypothetical protein
MPNLTWSRHPCFAIAPRLTGSSRNSVGALNPPGDCAKWDGLMSWFATQSAAEPSLMRQSFIRRWYLRLLKVLQQRSIALPYRGAKSGMTAIKLRISNHVATAPIARPENAAMISTWVKVRRPGLARSIRANQSRSGLFASSHTRTRARSPCALAKHSVTAASETRSPE